MDTKKPCASYGFVTVLIIVLTMVLVGFLGFGQSAEGEVLPQQNPAIEEGTVTQTSITASDSRSEQQAEAINPIIVIAVFLLVFAVIGVVIDFIAMRCHYETRGRIPSHMKRPSVK